MLKTGKRINPYRKYSEEFKRKLVEDYEKGILSVPQLERPVWGLAMRLFTSGFTKYSTYNEKKHQNRGDER